MPPIEETTMKKQEACLVCGKPLRYFETARPMACVFCGRAFDSYAACEDGHFVCDTCHAAKGVDAVMDYCLHTTSRDPIAIVQAIMDTPYVYMHGPEHHIMVGATLLAAYKNSGGAIDLPAALAEMRARGGQYPGGSCGFWGCCGAAVSAGMFLSIATDTTPLSGKTWGLSNRLTGRCLSAIGALGGPRCCKRNSFTALREAVAFVKEELGVAMELPAHIACTHSAENKECLRKACPYHVK